MLGILIVGDNKDEVERLQPWKQAISVPESMLLLHVTVTGTLDVLSPIMIKNVILKFMGEERLYSLTCSWPQGEDKNVFALLMFCVHFEQHHCMERVDDSIDLSMLIHSSQAFPLVH
jgi:hypothetical protein